MNLTRCLIYWNDPSVIQLLMRHHETSREKQTNKVVCVGLYSPKTAPNLPDSPDFFFWNQMGVERSYPGMSWQSKDLPDGLSRAV